MTTTTSVVAAPAPERCRPRTTSSAARPRFVLLGGVPGAGKTTALAALAATAADRPRAPRRLDPEGVRRRVADALPDRVPYRAYRAVVHLAAAARLAVILARGAGAGGDVVVHDPATRPRRRTLLGRLARARGWDPVLVVLDVTREDALQGQRDRRRVLRAGSFSRHWRRWEQERPRLLAAQRGSVALGPWSAVHVVDRGAAAAVLRTLTG